MISEHKPQVFMYDIRDDIRDNIIHAFKWCIPTSENALGRELQMQPLAGTSAAGSKLETVTSTRPGLSSASDAIRQAMCDVLDPSQAFKLKWNTLLREITSQLGISTRLKVILQY
jgi:hypothetical protein